MASSRRPSNGRSPLVNPQRQITSFFAKTSSSSPSPSPSPIISKQNPKQKASPSLSPSPSPTTPSPIQTKQKKPLLVIGPPPTSPSTPASDTAATPKTADKCYGQEVVNRRIRVYWPLDQSWYEGCVKSFNKFSGKHLIQYDDADEELLDLAKEKLEWDEKEKSTKTFRRLRRRVSVIEDEEVESGGDNSSDEDWGKNAEKEADEDVSEDMDLENEEDGVGSAKRTGGKNSVSRKRKTNGGGVLDSCKKSKNGGDVEKRTFRVSLDGNAGKLMEPTNNNDSK